MTSELTPSPIRRWSGRILSALAVLFLLFDGIAKLAHAAPVLEAVHQLGYPESSITVIGVLVLLCTVLYALPWTAVAGAVLLTGFLGGAVASQLRIDAPLFSNILFPVYIGGIAWAGLLLRRPGLWSVILPGRAL